MKLKIAIGITGASGAIYAKVLLDKLVHLHDQLEEVGIVLSSNAPDVWSYELGDGLIDKYPFKI